MASLKIYNAQIVISQIDGLQGNHLYFSAEAVSFSWWNIVTERKSCEHRGCEPRRRSPVSTQHIAWI